MGYYFKRGYYFESEKFVATNKAQQIVDMYGGEIVNAVNKLTDLPKGKSLIMVVENGVFDAAAFAYSQDELEYFLNDGSDRKKTFLLVDTDIVRKQCNYNK